MALEKPLPQISSLKPRKAKLKLSKLEVDFGSAMNHHLVFFENPYLPAPFQKAVFTMQINRRDFIRQAGTIVVGTGFLPIATENLWGQTESLPMSTPEAQGVSSQGILDFLDAIGKSRHEFHGFVLVRNGHIVAQGWWSPYRPDLNHSMYSMSKSFTSTAIGFAVTEKLLTVQDKVISFFPNELPEVVSDHLKAMTVKHLLSMSVGHATDTTWEMVQTDNWVKNFLSFPVEKAPGSEFLYNSGATYMLSAILQKVTGKTVLEWLTPRLLKPLGIGGATWDNCPMGNNTGGWGMHLTTGALAKFGQFLLQKGKWEGRQLLPASWVEEATTFQIQNGTPEAKETSDWAQGYCYQFWRCRHNAYRGDGAFGQYTIVMPEQNAVLAIHSESPDMQDQLNLVWKHLLPAMRSGTLAANPNAAADLKARLATLAIEPPKLAATSPLVTKISGRTYQVEPNENQVSQVSFSFKKDCCDFKLKNHLGEFTLTCGINHWQKGKTRMPGTPPDLFPILYEKLTTSKVLASAGWKDENTLMLYTQFYETAHHDTITCRFTGDTVEVTFLNSVSGMLPDFVKEKRVALKGKII